MTDTVDALVLDFVAWIAKEPRPYAEVMESWRTSCPRLPVWEDARDRGYVRRERIGSGGATVVPTEAGLAFLRSNGRDLAARDG